MRNSILCTLLSLVAIAAVGCSSESTEGPTAQGSRALTGRIQPAAGVNVTEVAALVSHAGAPTDVYRAPVDAQGGFRLELPKGERYVLQLMSGETAVGNIRFASSSAGALTSILPMASVPGGAGATPQAEDVSEPDVDLGDVSSAGGSDDDKPVHALAPPPTPRTRNAAVFELAQTETQPALTGTDEVGARAV